MTYGILGRKPIEVDRLRLEALVAGRRIAVTGAGGSIGSVLCRRLKSLWPRALMAIDNHEPSLYGLGQSVELQARLGDIRDAGRMTELFNQFRPEIVFHAAAYKHVPGLETDWREALAVNALGAMNVLYAAVNVEALPVLISTDKAADPVSVLGASKRMAELMFRKFGIAVRFGNVFGSSGSVVPRFAAQIAAGGPVEITHPDMERFFMTGPEACNLVIAAAGLGKSPLYALQTGKPLKIVTLAERMIERSGTLGVEIVYTGVRPGEKISEQLIADSETAISTAVPEILAIMSSGSLPIVTADSVTAILASGNRDAIFRCI